MQSNRTKVQSYQEILNDFSTIKAVKICGNTVKVTGLSDSQTNTRTYAYSNKSIAKFVAQKVSYFKGI